MEWSRPITGCRHKRYTDTCGVEPPNHWVSTQEIHEHRRSGAAQSLGVDTRDTRTQVECSGDAQSLGVDTRDTRTHVEWRRTITGCRYKRYTDTGGVEWSRPVTGSRLNKYTDTGGVEWSRPTTGCRYKRYTGNCLFATQVSKWSSICTPPKSAELPFTNRIL